MDLEIMSAQNIGNGLVGSSVLILETVTNNNNKNNNTNNNGNDFDGDSVCHTDVGPNSICVPRSPFRRGNSAVHPGWLQHDKFWSTLAQGCMCFLFLLFIYIFFEKHIFFKFISIQNLIIMKIINIFKYLHFSYSILLCFLYKIQF